MQILESIKDIIRQNYVTELSYFYEGATHINTFYERPSNRYSQSWTTPHVQGKKMSDMPVYVLTSNMTGSAAEEFAYDIQQSKRGVVIGQTTAGVGHIAAMMPLVDGFSMIVPIGKPINDTIGELMLHQSYKT